MKKLFSLFLSIVTIFMLVGCSSKRNYDIVSTSFVGYDFSRAVVGDKLTVKMLLNPGEELHDYSPSINDIECILNSKLFIYVGGESDSEWVEDQILPEINKDKTVVLNMMDVVKEKGVIYNEESPSALDEIDDEEEYDEHIWNSLTNAKVLVNEIYLTIAENIVEQELKTQLYYLGNANNYYEKIQEKIDFYNEMINSSAKKKIIFADRFPLLYFVKEFNLEYDAASKGCESSKEANPKVIENLIKEIKENNIKIIFTIELSESNIANTIKETLKKDGYDVDVRTYYTMHNVSKEDFKKGLTYCDFLDMNYDNLKAAIN